MNSSPAVGPWLIAFGLTILLTAVLFPSIPAVSAMAIVALGATQSTLLRFRHSPVLPSIMLLHAATYLSLYLTFVCAVLYTPAAGTANALSLLGALDLAASILPMAMALQTVGASLRPAADSRP
jgi:hypothetical protein